MADYVVRIEDARTRKAVFFGDFKGGKRDRGALIECHKDQLKILLAQAGIELIISRGGRRPQTETVNLGKRSSVTKGRL